MSDPVYEAGGGRFGRGPNRAHRAALRVDRLTTMRFRDLAKLPDEEIDLGRAALLMATMQYPDLDVENGLARLDGLASAVRERMGEATGDFKQLEAMTRYLYGELGFRGNHDEYYDPRNSFLNDVLERRLGIPISLAVLLIEVGKRAGIPLFGIGLPGHFLVRHARHVELLMDPFDKGRIVTRAECVEILSRIPDQVAFEPAMLKPVGPRQMLVRMHNNLRAIYLHNGQIAEAIRVFDRLMQLEPAVAQHRRDRGVLRLRVEDPEGVSDIEQYLEESPDAPERSKLETLLAVAEKLRTVH